ncbi:MAG: HigA family addiction module antidote protein [Verrucomicrobia bacterium]|nr:HigA family addiction module antidote protein [Verrucomicrobiota bacterium]
MLPQRRKPTHPGKVLMEDFLKPLLITPRQFAERLGGNWSEVKIEGIIKGKENLSEDAINQFAEALGTSPSFWRQLQSHYNQWEEIHRHNEKGSLKPWKKAQ